MSMATTVKEAEEQSYTVPPQFNDDTWRSFAKLIDGYAIAKELGHDLINWGNTQVAAHSGAWSSLSELELRLMLFYAFRVDYMTGYTYHEQDGLVDELLAALAEKTGQPYQRKA